MAQLSSAEAYAIALEALARVRALEMFVFVSLEHATGRSAEELEASFEKRAAKSRERLWRLFGHDEVAMRVMLDALGVAPASEGPESPEPPQQ